MTDSFTFFPGGDAYVADNSQIADGSQMTDDDQMDGQMAVG